MHAAGLLLALGSDSPVARSTRGLPCAARSSTGRRRRASTSATAFTAATRNGHRAVGRDDVGVLAPGQRATFAVWDGASADPQLWAQLVTPGHVEMAPGTPTCVRTVVDGVTIHGSDS